MVIVYKNSHQSNRKLTCPWWVFKPLSSTLQFPSTTSVFTGTYYTTEGATKPQYFTMPSIFTKRHIGTNTVTWRNLSMLISQASWPLIHGFKLQDQGFRLQLQDHLSQPMACYEIDMLVFNLKFYLPMLEEKKNSRHFLSKKIKKSAELVNKVSLFTQSMIKTWKESWVWCKA